jgi:uncharacterized protein (DUF1697 family)
MQTVVFLRALNTTGRRVKMDALRQVVGSVGFPRVQSVLASGNLIIDSDRAVDAVTIETAIEVEFGFFSKAFVRTADEIADVLAKVPFSLNSGMAEIAFLEHAPPQEAASALMAAATGPDKVVIVDREIYWWRPLPLVPPYPKETTVRSVLRMQSTRRTLRTVQRISSILTEHA